MIDPSALKEIEEVFKHFKKIGASHEQSASLTLAYAHLKTSGSSSEHVNGPNSPSNLLKTGKKG